MANKADKSEYRGKRALILTRVSTAKQEEKYSHAAQERQVREKLIIPLGLTIVDEKRHIIHDTHTKGDASVPTPLYTTPAPTRHRGTGQSWLRDSR